MLRRSLPLAFVFVTRAVAAQTTPSTVEDFHSQMKALRTARRAAQHAHDDAAFSKTNSNLALLELWGGDHIHRRDPTLFAGGFFMLGLGVATLAAGLVVLSAGVLSGSGTSNSNGQWDSCFLACPGDTKLMIAGGVMMAGGGVLGLLSIPFIASGKAQVVDSAPRARVDIGPTRVGLSVTF